MIKLNAFLFLFLAIIIVLSSFSKFEKFARGVYSILSGAALFRGFSLIESGNELGGWIVVLLGSGLLLYLRANCVTKKSR